MNYIDMDVLIHYLVKQDLSLNLKAISMIDKLIIDNQFIISWLSIQEIGFVLNKLNQPNSLIQSKLNYLMACAPVQYGLNEFERAMQLAEIIGFKNFNDCLHTAIAERHCTDFHTCNYKDFKKLQSHTNLIIHFFNDQLV
jgi:predicted nucleic acid-binding protein